MVEAIPYRDGFFISDLKIKSNICTFTYLHIVTFAYLHIRTFAHLKLKSAHLHIFKFAHQKK